MTLLVIIQSKNHNSTIRYVLVVPYGITACYSPVITLNILTLGGTQGVTITIIVFTVALWGCNLISKPNTTWYQKHIEHTNGEPNLNN